MTNRRKNHSWSENSIPVSSFPEEVYKISECKKCGLVRLHELRGNNYSKKYVAGNLIFETMPECKPKSKNNSNN